MGWETHWHKHPAVPTGDQLTFGQRAADFMRAAMGSWTFVFSFILAMLCWAAVNTVYLQRFEHHKPFDPYPYILLNLLLSTLAGLQGAILLIAAKRADQIASIVAAHTAENTDYLRKVLDQNTQLLAENTKLTQALHEHLVDKTQR